MVQNCVDAASTDFSSYNLKRSRDAADVVGSKSTSIHSPVQHHINTIGSMQPGSVEFVSKVLPLNNHSYSPTSAETVPIESSSLYKTNTNISSSSSSGYESVVSRSTKSHRSLFSRLKRLINFPSSKKSVDYPLSVNNPSNDISVHSPMLTIRPTTNTSSSGMANSAIDYRRNSLTRLDIRRKSSRRTLAPATQHVPFIYGLKNCGNTCFINAIVQCLCHTEQLALYIIHKDYEIDMRNIKNAITHSSNSLPPVGFKVTKAFVQIFQALWNNSSNTTSKLLYDFKSIIGNLNRQYAGNDQNDAQEFLLFLINTIHDELNLVGHGRCRQQKNKNSFSSVIMSPSFSSSSSLSSEELARRAWSEYADANQSIITNTFSAQLHSTLRCNQCKQESKTFEPYLLLSLPIPQKMIKPVFITVVFLNQSPKQLQIGLCLPVMSTVKDVREAIAQQSNLDPNDLALVEIQPNHGYSQVFHDTDLMSRLSQDVYAIQFPSSTSSSNSESLESTNEPNNSSSTISNHHFVNLLVLNRVKTISGRFERFGAPIAVRVPRESNYRALQLSIIKAQRSLLRDEAMEYAQDFVVFQLSLIDHYRSNTGVTNKQEYPIHHDVQWPLYLEKIVEILDAYDGHGLGPAHIQVYATWPEKYLGQFIAKYGMSDDKPDIHQSVAQARNALHQPSTSSISLADCFSLFTQSESLNYDDAWMCTHCRRKENGTVKNLKISTTPSVLIIHLKRFCQTKLSNAKLVYPVQFPLMGLDVRRFLATNRNDDSGADDCHELIEIDQERQHGLYDLYAVCNHRGSMSNGHYTAYCKNPVTHKWYCYDDHLVSEIDPSRVCTPDAYILFYKRRDHPSSLANMPPAPPLLPPSSSSTQSHLSSTPSPQIDEIQREFDERLTIDEHSPRSNGPVVSEEKSITWSSPREKPPVQYILQPPLPLPRRLLTPISLSASHDETTPVQSTSAPCPAPRARKPAPIEVEIDPYPTSPPQRRLPIAPPPPTPSTYAYTIANRSNDPLIEPLSEFHPSLSHRYPVMEQNSSPWNRYNHQRYSDDEPETNVFYQTSIVRK